MNLSSDCLPESWLNRYGPWAYLFSVLPEIVVMQTLDYVLFMFLYPIDNALKVNAGLDDTDDDDDDDERGRPRGNGSSNGNTNSVQMGVYREGFASPSGPECATMDGVVHGNHGFVVFGDKGIKYSSEPVGYRIWRC